MFSASGIANYMKNHFMYYPNAFKILIVFHFIFFKSKFEFYILFELYANDMNGT